MKNKYNADSINVLEGLEPVRLRPSMYIGNVDVAGLHHLVYEIVDNSIDESMAGFCDRIKVTIHSDNGVSVEDNGRGIPVGIHKTENVPAVEVVLTKLHAGGKFDNKSYKVSGGLHGVGVSVVNALSEYFEVEIKKHGNIYRQTFERGIKTSELQIVDKTEKEGTKIYFMPDADIFNNVEFSYEILARRLRELAFLNKGVSIIIEDERCEVKNEFHYQGGIVSFVEYLNKRHISLHDPIYIEGVKNDVKIEIAIQYNNTFKEILFSFANNINTVEGGFHLSGFKAGITRSINQYVATGSLPKNLQEKISGDDVREGLSAIISVKLKSPQFEGQTKTKLGNSEVKGFVESIINEKLGIFLEENPVVGKKIVEKAVDAARVRNAAKRARDLARKQGSLIDSALPGKLAECQSSDPKEKEIFLVEGDSAGGSAKQGRDRRFQAILPLKGKILNVEKARFDKVLLSEEIKNIITALGTGVGREEYDIEKVRYHKVIIMTDADVDGAHIKALLLTFFYRQMQDLIEKGYLYIAYPPLYKVGTGKNAKYLKDDLEYYDYILKRVSSKINVKSGKDDKILSDEALYDLACDLAQYYTLMLKLEMRGYKSDFIEFLLKSDFWDANLLKDQDKMTSLRDTLICNGYSVEELIYNEQRNVYEFMVNLNDEIQDEDLFSETKQSKIKPVKIGRSLLHSNDFQKILLMRKKTFNFNPPFSLFVEGKKDDPVVVEDKKQFFHLLIEEGKKGLSIQRYKGLGEMNPDQLWETTMSPEKRMLQQVKIEDAVETDETFTVLMGEEVEPRREFIHNNALEVSVLDI